VCVCVGGGGGGGSGVRGYGDGVGMEGARCREGGVGERVRQGVSIFN
jgi:hypothetical protein